MKNQYGGVVVPVVTPFDKTGAIDLGALDVILEYLLERGIHGIMPIGSQGEFYALSTNEKQAVIDAVVKRVKNRAFIIVHVGEIATHACINLAQYAEAAGTDAVAVITPFYITPSQQELIDHYKKICSAVSVPVFAYNNPDRSGVNLKPETIMCLAEETENFVGIKDSSGDIELTASYVRASPEGFHTFVGRDSLIYEALIRGAVGAVASTANAVPDLVVSLYNAFQSGNLDRARQLQSTLNPLRGAFSLGTFPCVVKDAMNLLGLPAGKPRLPVKSLSGLQNDQLKAILSSII